MKGVYVVYQISVRLFRKMDLIVVGDGHFGESEILLDRDGDIKGIEHNRGDFVGDGSGEVVLVGDGVVEFGVIVLQEVLQILPTSRTGKPIIDGESEALAR